jgi:hypothetical protein
MIVWILETQLIMGPSNKEMGVSWQMEMGPVVIEQIHRVTAEWDI